ncbi:unnamed protein product [Cuscuta campestris]|uniref:Uncharacterized protein n=1 Tax=Cuscuta campestris TaxID=132261 RepID=A0A484NIX3_9ASTE|nr:unnamed protein product [Cuscuta campestris]
MGSGKSQSAKKTNKKNPKKKDKVAAITEEVSLGTDIAVDIMGKEKAQTSSSTSETSPHHVEGVEVTPVALEKTTVLEKPQVLNEIPQLETVSGSIKPVTFADLFKQNKDPDQGRFPGLKAVDAIVKSWNVPCRIIPHCKGRVELKFENDRDRYEVLGMERCKAYGKEFRIKIPSHGFMFDFAEFTTLLVWIQLHNVPMQMW